MCVCLVGGASLMNVISGRGSAEGCACGGRGFTDECVCVFSGRGSACISSVPLT